MKIFASGVKCSVIFPPKIRLSHFMFFSHFVVVLSDSTLEFHISTFDFTILHSSFACDITLGSAAAHSLFIIASLTILIYVCLIIL